MGKLLTAVIVIVAIVFVGILVLSRERGSRVSKSTRRLDNDQNLINEKRQPIVDGGNSQKIGNYSAQNGIDDLGSAFETGEPNYFIDDRGRRYMLVAKAVDIPRKTFLLGKLSGKYWGELDFRKTDEFEQLKFFDFHVYESKVVESRLASAPFQFDAGTSFPRERLPQLLPIILHRDGREYAVNIYEPQLAEVRFISKLHQTEGKEIFGTIEAMVTGYLLDFVTEQVEERLYLEERTGTSLSTTTELTKTNIATGEIERKSGYQRIRYYYSDYKSTYWGDWNFKRQNVVSVGQGCLSSGISLAGGIIGLLFMVLMLPRIALFLPFLLIPLLLRFIPAVAWLWFFRVIGAASLIWCIISIVNANARNSSVYVPRSVAADTKRKISSESVPVVDSINGKPEPDTLIRHYGIWDDYDANHYEGNFWVRKSEAVESSNFKNTISIPGNTYQSYDELVFKIKENDKDRLEGIFQLFDSIRLANGLSKMKFAEAIVCFVQTIPYCVVLPSACDPSLYGDNFIKSYLASEGARCDGFQRFGINTPVEFMTSLNGDCDTRTLLLYTILAHYNYDVVLLSSEYYNHSLIGINLPYAGIAYQYNTQRYVLWETTSAEMKPGILPNEISNLNYWRISLKSKQHESE